jgi:hypothetical protein
MYYKYSGEESKERLALLALRPNWSTKIQLGCFKLRSNGPKSSIATPTKNGEPDLKAMLKISLRLNPGYGRSCVVIGDRTQYYEFYLPVHLKTVHLIFDFDHVQELLYRLP